jgi:ABC-type oligopeptide transport system substrate-binding subunit
MRLISALVIGIAATGSVAEARAGSLATEDDINAGLFNVAVADRIRNKCDEISPRYFTALSYLQRLKGEARKRGYSDAEIDRYINDDAERAKMEERRNAYIRASGAHPGDRASLCRLGRQEIARDSQIGQLLRAR